MIDNLAEHSPELAAQLRERCLHASDEQHNVSLVSFYDSLDVVAQLFQTVCSNFIQFV